MKLSFLKSIEQFAITHLGVIQDSDNDMTALMQRNGMLSDSDGCDDLEDFDLDDFDVEDESGLGIEPNYIKRHIERIPQHGDDSRWRLAEYLDMFDNLSRDGSLTNEQRQAVDNFVTAYQQGENNA